MAKERALAVTPVRPAKGKKRPAKTTSAPATPPRPVSIYDLEMGSVTIEPSIHLAAKYCGAHLSQISAAIDRPVVVRGRYVLTAAAHTIAERERLYRNPLSGRWIFRRPGVESRQYARSVERRASGEPYIRERWYLALDLDRGETSRHRGMAALAAAILPHCKLAAAFAMLSRALHRTRPVGGHYLIFRDGEDAVCPPGIRRTSTGKWITAV